MNKNQKTDSIRKNRPKLVIFISVVIFIILGVFITISYKADNPQSNSRIYADQFMKAYGECDFETLTRLSSNFSGDSQITKSYRNTCKPNEYSFTFNNIESTDSSSDYQYSYALIKDGKNLGSIQVLVMFDSESKSWDIFVDPRLSNMTNDGQSNMTRQVIDNTNKKAEPTPNGAVIPPAKLIFPSSSKYTIGYSIGSGDNNTAQSLKISDMTMIYSLLDKGDIDNAISCDGSLAIMLDYSGNSEFYENRYVARNKVLAEKILPDGRVFSLVSYHDKCTQDQKEFIDYIKQVESY